MTQLALFEEFDMTETPWDPGTGVPEDEEMHAGDLEDEEEVVEGDRVLEGEDENGEVS